MGKKPMTIKVEASECIESTEEVVEARRNGFVYLNVLWTYFSCTSTSTDASNGTNWRYFPGDRNIKMRVKNTPQCQEWLRNAVVTDQYVPMPSNTSNK